MYNGAFGTVPVPPVEYRSTASIPDPAGTAMITEQVNSPITSKNMGQGGWGGAIISVPLDANTLALHLAEINYLFADGQVRAYGGNDAAQWGSGTFLNPKGIWMVDPNNR